MKRLAILLLILMAACSRAPAGDEGIVEVITLEECESSGDVCCETACKDFCREKSRAYAKQTPNGNQCGCWCD